MAKKHLKEAGKYDPGDAIPPQGAIPGEDDPLLAVKFIESNDLDPDGTIVGMFTPDEKKRLLEMIDNGEFSKLEALVIQALMSEAAKLDEIAMMSDEQREAALDKKNLHIGGDDEAHNLEDVGVVIGATSRRTKGKPVSKPAALKELNRIGKVIAKRSKAKYGKAIDFKAIPKYRKEMKKIAEWKRKKAIKAKQYANAQEREFHRLLAELRRTQKAHGLKQARQVDPADWKPGSGDVPYVRKFVKPDKDISKMKKFGGTPDERQ